MKKIRLLSFILMISNLFSNTINAESSLIDLFCKKGYSYNREKFKCERVKSKTKPHKQPISSQDKPSDQTNSSQTFNPVAPYNINNAAGLYDKATQTATITYDSGQVVNFNNVSLGIQAPQGTPQIGTITLSNSCVKGKPCSSLVARTNVYGNVVVNTGYIPQSKQPQPNQITPVTTLNSAVSNGGTTGNYNETKQTVTILDDSGNVIATFINVQALVYSQLSNPTPPQDLTFIGTIRPKITCSLCPRKTDLYGTIIQNDTKNQNPTPTIVPESINPNPEVVRQPMPGSNPMTYAPQIFTPADSFAEQGLVGNYYPSSSTATMYDPSGQNPTKYSFNQVIPVDRLQGDNSLFGEFIGTVQLPVVKTVSPCPDANGINMCMGAWLSKTIQYLYGNKVQS